MSTPARPRVHLHIGTPKSGTTSVQAALLRNRETLATDGVWHPSRSRDQISAGREVLRHSPSMRRWAELARQVRDSTGHAAVISMESLCTARPKQARRAVRAFRDLDVRVVITARDLARTIPAQWQESTQFRHTWSYREYLEGVTASRPLRTPAGRSFWRQHDLGRIIEIWRGAVGADHITVVTLPKRAQPDVLWRRFAETVGIDPGRATLPETRNESLGAASAELMRRVNAGLVGTDLSRKEYAASCRQVLAKTVLATRSRNEPRLSLPRELQRWAEERSGQLVETVRASGVAVVGDLADLRTEADSATDVDPEQLASDVLLDAAVDAIVGLVHHQAGQERVRRARRQER